MQLITQGAVAFNLDLRPANGRPLSVEHLAATLLKLTPS